MFRTAIIATAAVFTLSAGVAAAQQAPSMNISTKGLDVQTTQGAQAYLARVTNAASQVCGGSSYFMPSEQDQIDACVKSTVADAVAATHAPLVTALYDHRTAETQMASK